MGRSNADHEVYNMIMTIGERSADAEGTSGGIVIEVHVGPDQAAGLCRAQMLGLPTIIQAVHIQLHWV